MAKMKQNLSKQLRAQIDAAPMSRYALAQATGIDPASLSRFMAGKTGLLLSAVDAIVEELGLELVAPKRRKRKVAK
ncbi:MAG: helix-turn-helix domain-containing protein [Phycisphaerae bacterium]